MVQVRTFYKTVIDKKELFSPAPLCKFRLPYKSLYFYDLRILFHRYELLIGLSSQNIYNPLAIITGRKLEQFPGIVKKRELYSRVGQCNPLKLVNNVSHFHCVTLQEIAPGRDIIEKILHADGSPYRGYAGFLGHHFAAF